jgi:nucleoside 2-deoxyribosyltransferase
MDTKKKCYIASGFFNPEQNLDVDRIIGILRSLSVDYFSPRDHNLIKPDASQSERKAGVLMNITQIEKCDFIIVNTRDKDMGTLFEAGIAYATDIPIIYYCDGLKGQFNLMLANTGICVATNNIELSMYVMSFLKNPGFKKEYSGDIE